MALLAELAERDATGEKGAIYSEIRRLGGVPMVALIFRHLATLPGTLEWAWGVVGPSWRAGLVRLPRFAFKPSAGARPSAA
jgi:hypothetical protein